MSAEKVASRATDGLATFWRNLLEGYAWFEERGRPPEVSVDAKGRYLFR
jgi:murein L,D-transpeptidase YafK